MRTAQLLEQDALTMINELTDLLDEDVYGKRRPRRARGDALRALLDAAGDIDSVVTGLIDRLEPQRRRGAVAAE